MKSKFGDHMTARGMAFLPHNLSADGDTAKRKDRSVWKWSALSNVWVCMQSPKMTKAFRRCDFRVQN